LADAWTDVAQFDNFTNSTRACTSAEAKASYQSVRRMQEEED
jgi:hypothetical protein